jgi:hypothetical protein
MAFDSKVHKALHLTPQLEDAGERERRPRKPRTLPCQHCGATIQEDDPKKVYVRVLEGHGWLCSAGCAIAHLSEHATLSQPRGVSQDPPSQSRIQNPESKIDPSPPEPEKRDSESRSAPDAQPEPFESTGPKPVVTFTGVWRIRGECVSDVGKPERRQ